jgi:hypothetical protein
MKVAACGVNHLPRDGAWVGRRKKPGRDPLLALDPVRSLHSMMPAAGLVTEQATTDA